MTEQRPFSPNPPEASPEMQEADIRIGLIQLEPMLAGDQAAFYHNQLSTNMTPEGEIQITKLAPELVNLAIAVRRFATSPALQEFNQSQAQKLQSARQGPQPPRPLRPPVPLPGTGRPNPNA